MRKILSKKGLLAPLFLLAAQFTHAGTSSGSGSAMSAVNTQLNTMMSNILGVLTSGWVTVFLAILIVFLIIGYMMNRQDDEAKANFFRIGVGAAVLLSVQSIASMLYNPSATGALF